MMDTYPRVLPRVHGETGPKRLESQTVQELLRPLHRYLKEKIEHKGSENKNARLEKKRTQS